MPRGRVLDKRISRSEKFAALRFDRSRVLYMMILSYTDVDGRIWAEPQEIKLDVCPMLKYSERQIAEALVDMWDAKLIDLYPDARTGVPVAQYTAFHKMNVVRRDQEAKSKFSAPPPGKQRCTTVVQQLRCRCRCRGREEKRGGGSVSKVLTIYFDARAREWKGITTADIELWKKAYPDCDIELELYRMADWVVRNWTTTAGTPGKGQKSNWPAFIRNWLAREQREGGTKHFKIGSDKLPPSLQAWVEKKEGEK